jgi:hypothetical protein
MDSDTSKEKIIQWLDDGMISGHTTRDDITEFNIEVIASGRPIHIIRDPRDDASVRILHRINFDAETLALITDRAKIKRDLLVQLASVLTNAPGFYQYMNKSEEACEFRDMEMILLEHRLYEPELNQQTLMNTIMNFVTASQYILQSVSAMVADIDGNR